MKVFNAYLLNNRQRWAVALITGPLFALAAGFAFGMLRRVIPFELEILYIGVGWLIGSVIARTGRGVTVKFAVLSLICAAVSFLVSDLVFHFAPGILLQPAHWGSCIMLVLRTMMTFHISAFLNLIFRAVGLYYAYQTARFI